MQCMHNLKITKCFIFAGLMFSINFCFASFQDHLGVYMKIPKYVCDKVTYVDQDDSSTGTIPVGSDGNYDLRSRHDYKHSSQGKYNKRRDYYCYSKGKGAAFNFSEIWGYWQHVDIENFSGSKAVDGRTNILVDDVKIPCGNGDETVHYWRVFWRGSTDPGGWSRCPNTNVGCIDAGFFHLCSNNGFDSGTPSMVSVPANWKIIYFEGIESGHSASTSTHYYIHMYITHVNSAPQPKFTDSLLLISVADNSKLYDTVGVPLATTTTKVLSSQDETWYRVGVPKGNNLINLKLLLGLSQDAQDKLINDGTYTCLATVKSTNGSGLLTKTIISKSQSYLSKNISVDASHQNYKFLDAGNYKFSGDSKNIDLQLSITCENSHPDEDINFYPQKIRLYKVQHF